ncbi:MAG TPA: hypothetical protein VFB20_15995 [Burkholderiales bacterium]|nr:hypothetical protein [Burkholderiales bacterium]
MRQLWQKLSDRFARLARRERVIVLGGGVVAIMLVAGSAIDTSLGRARQLEAKVSLARADAAVARAKTAEFIRQLAQDPDAVTRARIAQVRTEIERIDVQLKGLHGGLVTPARMAGILEDMLTRNRRVQLVGLRTLPVTPLVEARKESRQESGQGETARNVYKHGIELTLQGGYLDLLDYLARLERLPWQMFWAQARLDATDYPRVRITVTVYTLSLDKDWLVV